MIGQFYNRISDSCFATCETQRQDITTGNHPEMYVMKRCFCLIVMLLVGAVSHPGAYAQHAAAQNLFDGKSLENWDGNPKFWSVEDGVITGTTTKENPTDGNTFIIWKGGHVADFELTIDYRMFGGNSGIQYRSFQLPNGKDQWRVGGYQGDHESGKTYSGILYGEQFRGILAQRGEKTELVRKNGKFQVKVTGSVGDTNKIQSKIKHEDWNTYKIVAKGNHFQHFINGVPTVDVTDNDIQMRRKQGILALQLHAGPPMKVQFRNIVLKQLTSTRQIILIAGTKSHGYGAHEHKAGCMLLADALNNSGLPVAATVVTVGWPKDESVFDDADSVVIYCDGGDRHPFNSKIKELNILSQRGVGIACLHYGVEVPRGASGNAFLEWTGGFFEANWSVNPHWTANYTKFPKHPITSGVAPFRIHDEWYYHMRFRDGMEGVTPILTDLPPSSTLVKEDGSLARADNAHNNNKFVRAAVLERKEPQHMAWARERPDAGRGFGFTGGHDHWNWGNDSFRKLVLNAIVWTAGVEVPTGGVPSKTPTVKDLQANQDEPVNEKRFNPARIEKMINDWNSAAK
jgi:hypothetical protein